MNALVAVLTRVADDLHHIGHSWCLIGGIAVSARTEPRFTRDVDVAIGVPGDEAAERVVHRLMGVGYRVRQLIEQQAMGRLATTRLIPPGGEEHGVVVDVLFASCGIEPEVVGAAELLEVFPDTTVPVATIGHLLAMKVLSCDDERRPQDRVDIVALLRRAGAADLEQARTAVSLMVQRGSNRDRDLVKMLDDMLARSRS